MNLAKMIQEDKELKGRFDQAVYLEELADSIDYVNNEKATQQDIDDHVIINQEFSRAVENVGLTPVQYYEVKTALVS